MMRLCVVCALLLLGGCSYLPPMPFSGDETSPPEPTLASLEPIPRAEVAEEMPALSLVELESAYREVLTVTEDPGLQLKVRRRLAGLEVLSSEAGDDGLAAADAWSGAIAAYQALLQDYPDAAGRDQLLYQMARAQDMNGQGDQAVRLMEQLSSEHPDSGHVAEAEFRKGEAYFGEGDYRRAEQAYARVAQADTGNDYFDNSMYMLGWSRFKQDDYAAAVQAFIQALDHLMVSNKQLDQLPRGDREMAADCFRVLAVIFSYQGGSDAIAASFRVACLQAICALESAQNRIAVAIVFLAEPDASLRKDQIAVRVFRQDQAGQSGDVNSTHQVAFGGEPGRIAEVAVEEPDFPGPFVHCLGESGFAAGQTFSQRYGRIVG